MLLRAGLPIPPADYYMDFPQLENGVGMLALFYDDWASVSSSLRVSRPGAKSKFPLPASRWSSSTVATGLAAAAMLRELLKPFPDVAVVPVKNRFFGESVDVAGLLTGSDLLEGLQGKALGERVLIPSSMLRRGEDVFLDGMTVFELSEKLGVPVVPVEPDAESLWRYLNDRD
jgi:NifB/MoaA-like Fe-S oxidoreductase